MSYHTGGRSWRSLRGTHFVSTKHTSFHSSTELRLRFWKTNHGRAAMGCPNTSSLRCSHASIMKQRDDDVYTDTDLSKHSHTLTFEMVAYLARYEKTTKCMRKVINWMLPYSVFTFSCSSITAYLPSLTHSLLLCKFNLWMPDLAINTIYSTVWYMSHVFMSVLFLHSTFYVHQVISYSDNFPQLKCWQHHFYS